MKPDETLDLLDRMVCDVQSSWPGSHAEKLRTALEIGDLVRQLREWRGWNQHKLARRADVDMGLVIRLEAGLKLPRPSRMRVIADVLREGEWVPPEA